MTESPGLPDPQMSPTPPLLLAGPTAVGKSEVALAVAEQLNGEVVSVDSMQVYCGMDIGTAKPSAEDRRRVPHHLLDVAKVSEPFDAARFVRLAGAAIAGIEARGHIPILCGGTGLYFKALLEGLGEAPPASPELRAELEAALLEDLLHELSEKDPVAYERIDRKNSRRVIRAVEVIRLTGKAFSEQRAAWNVEHRERGPERWFGLTRPAPELRRRIDRRVEEMFHRGLVAETERLLSQGLSRNGTAMQALGYRQVVEHLRGERSLAETIELVKIRTRQFAKRQMTWFRNQLALEWLELAETQTPAAIAQKVLERLGTAE